MRIVAGEWRGRKLAELGEGDTAAHLRPSSDRLRETIFNILRHEKYHNSPQNMRVLDLFSGTGALALEALSRGASQAALVDNGAKSSTLIKQNIKTLGANDRAHFIRANACQLPPCKTQPFELVFLDPPYSQNLGEKAIESAHSNGWLAQNALILWEEALAPKLPNFLLLLEQRKVGRASLSIARVG